MPSVRKPVFHSPYSTVSASMANISVLTTARAMPRTPKKMIGMAGVDGGASETPMPPTMPSRPARM